MNSLLTAATGACVFYALVRINRDRPQNPIEGTERAARYRSYAYAFYAIVNIPQDSLPLVFREMERVLQPGRLLLLTFHAGDEILHEAESWGRPISMNFFLFQLPAILQYLEAAGLAIEEIIEREPYSPEVEYQSRRAYIFALIASSISRARRKRQRLPSSLLIENASDRDSASPQNCAPRRFRSSLATTRPEPN